MVAGAHYAEAQEPTLQQYELSCAGPAAISRSCKLWLVRSSKCPVRSMWKTAPRGVLGLRARALASPPTARRCKLRAPPRRLGPVPEAGDLSEPYRRQAGALPEMMDGIDNFIAEYEQGIAAVERNDPRALTIAAISSNNATILILTQFRNLNALQAESLDRPAALSASLLREFLRGYDLGRARAKRRLCGRFIR